MGNLATGGGSGAVAASQHSGCERFRRTDRMVLGRSRRDVAERLGSPDTTAGIPEARWMRAMTFERLIRHEAFVSRLLTTTVGALDLARPTGVRRADAGVRVDNTATVLMQAHLEAVHEGVATMVTSLAVPFVGLEGESGATPVKPDFAVVTPRFDVTGGQAESDVDVTAAQPMGSWLVMGDAKDYERVRAFIDDQRMLKGFLQVALGAESVQEWSKLPKGMDLHPWGSLAVPRNAFLQPVAVVERLDDHRAEVRARADERQGLREETGADVPDEELQSYVDHLVSTFNPATCPTCNLFNYCRGQIRAQHDPLALLTEIGVAPEERAGLKAVAAGESHALGVLRLPRHPIAEHPTADHGSPGSRDSSGPVATGRGDRFRGRPDSGCPTGLRLRRSAGISGGYRDQQVALGTRSRGRASATDLRRGAGQRA